MELVTYNVKCTITSLSGYEASVPKQVSITSLANTSVTDESDNSINANAVYSEYDLAYFRDLVNSKKEFNMNIKVMDNIIMNKVVNESWLPIDYTKNGFGATSGKTEDNASTYIGIFDRNNKYISNLKINNEILNIV